MKIALVGNQNSGKTTLFNTLTGMNAKIGNWPGVTIEKKTGIIKGTDFELTDLPGIYSLSPYSVEEDLSRKFVFDENPNIIINIIDSTSLERSLYLTTQLLELDCKVIVALNMVDILEKKGLIIDENKLGQVLGTKVLKISALKGTGIEELIQEIKKPIDVEQTYIYDTNMEEAIKKVESSINTSSLHKRFLAVKLLENDERFENISNEKIKNIAKELSQNYDTDLEEIIATERYQFIEQVKKQSVIKKETEESISDKLDKIFLNKFLALPIFILIMFLIYFLSVGVVGNLTVDWITGLVDIARENIGSALSKIGASEWVNSLIVDGIIAGVGAVLGFIPQLIILFVCIAILETTGYMSRIALLLDKLFRKIGLSGKSLIPFIVGAGCSVPGIMGTRIIENQAEREMTTILTPFIPCSAKLPIIALFSGYFFGKKSGFVSASLYFLAVAIIIISAIIMKKFVFKKTNNVFISELPEYKLPNMKYIAKDVLDKVIAFIKRAGSVILVCSIVIWFLLSFSFKLEYGVDVEKSILASIGKSISWAFYPMLGENSWGAAVSAIQGLVAKEQVISSMSVISGLAEEAETANSMFQKGIFNFFTASSAYAFMIFNLFSAPCFGAIGAMKRELGSNRKVLKALAYQTIFAWSLATIAYQIGSRLENGTLNMANILIISGIAIIVIKVLSGMKKETKNGCRNCPYSNSCKEHDNK
ncbi:MAG: ferrous iron transport protein B [Clostridia bacterium]|nr:ferrous iron transport protein B [Clostridia bacterium]